MRIVTSLTILGLVSLTLATGCGRFGSKKSTTPAPIAANEKKSEEAMGFEYVSPEKTIVDKALQRAKANGRLLMIDVSAAWCAPCQLAAKGMKTGSEKFNEISKKYEFLELEETYFSSDDFLPFDVSAFPTFVVVDPATNKWSVVVGYDTVDVLAGELETFASKKSLLDDSLIKFREDFAQNKKPEISFYNWTPKIIAEKSTQEIKDLLVEFKKAHADKPELFESTSNALEQLSYFKADMYAVLIARGGMTQQDLNSQDPDFLKSIANEFWNVNTFAFDAPLKNIRREQGAVAAAKACDALADKVNADYLFTPKAIPEGATAEEAKDITEANEHNIKYFETNRITRKSTCLLQRVLTKQAKKEEVLAFVSSFKEEDLATRKAALSYGELSKLLAFSGADFAKAAEYVEKSTAAGIAHKEKYIIKAEKEIAELKAAGKTEEAASEEFWLEGTKLCIPAYKKSAEERLAAYKAGLSHPALLK